MTEQEKNQSRFCICVYARILGLFAALAAGSAIMFLFLTDAMPRIESPYLGILIYFGLPAIFLAGVILAISGIYLCWRARQLRDTTYLKWPLLDLNDRSRRRAAVMGILGIIVFLIMGSTGAYQANHYMDTVTFCGKTCHALMKPEFTTHQQSPHAHVACVRCHIGPTAAWYVRAKLSGLYQVYATIVNTYPRPIPVPLKDLRPIRADCEQCHWPQMFFGSRERRFVHYRYDETNTEWPIRMLVRVGGSHPATVLPSGIHWHVSPAVKVEYIARDKSRQEIPWVKVTEKATGKHVIFQDTSNPFPEEQIRSETPRLMDCIDCHDNPSHNFLSPDYEIDQAILSGKIDRSVPYIKKTAVNAMKPEYESDDAAMDGIHESIAEYYKKTNPVFYSANKKLIGSAIRATQEAFQKSIFPYMKVRWTVYPDHIGHFITRGCTRCHDGKHKSNNGVVIPNNCNTCHIIISQGPTSPSEKPNLQSGLEFKHPIDIGGAWHGPSCYICHKGTQP